MRIRLTNLSGNGGFHVTTDSAAPVADHDLVVRAQSGDLGALNDLLAALRPAIVSFCRFRLGSYVGGRDAADDAVQETCLAVASVLGGYSDTGAPFRAWVYAIAANKVADCQRRLSRSAVLVNEMPEQVEPSPNPEQLAVATAEYRAAMSLVDRLPTTMRRVVLLRASGVNAKSVGDLLGISAGAVDVTHHRAVNRLRELADESEELRELFAPFRSHSGAPAARRVA